MTSPRHEVFDAQEVGEYHCISRCVRRAFLCGYDTNTGISYEHRRAWLRDRLRFLVEIFSIELIAYAIMSNHIHTLIRNRPDLTKGWSAEEVAWRWRKLFALRREKGVPAEPNEEEIVAISNNPTLVELYRNRLCSISWFNRCLCEFIARRANREDECTGRFWEGRFKSIRIHDNCGILACATYIDLNPVRAGEAVTPESSNYTSVQDRIRILKSSAISKQTPRLISIEEASRGGLSTNKYIELVDNTCRELADRKGKVSKEFSPILERLGINASKWHNTLNNYNKNFRRMVGPAEVLRTAGEKIGKKWFQGLAASRIAFC